MAFFIGFLFGLTLTPVLLLYLINRRPKWLEKKPSRY